MKDLDMLIIGLTGSIGMGKSAAAAMFRARGLPVCDADAEVHKLYSGQAMAPIEAAFPGTTRPDGVDRQKLAALLLADPTGFKKLEAIVHPLVRAVERDFLIAANAAGAWAAVLEIPLLFETGGDKAVDATVVVSAPAHLQKQRVLARPGMTEEKLAQILSRQWPDAQKRAGASFVVDTGGPLEFTATQVDIVLQDLKTGMRPAVAFERTWKHAAE
jgi:dephospho-CoA kinase